MLIQYTNIQHCIYANAKSMKSLVFTCSQSWRDNWEINLYVPPSILSCMVLYPQLNLHSYAPRFWKCSFLLRLTRTWNLSLSCLKLSHWNLCRYRNRVGKNHFKTSSSFLENLTLDTYLSQIFLLFLKNHQNVSLGYANGKLKIQIRKGHFWEIGVRERNFYCHKVKTNKSNLRSISTSVSQASQTQHNDSGTLDFPLQKSLFCTATLHSLPSSRSQ